MALTKELHTVAQRSLFLHIVRPPVSETLLPKESNSGKTHANLYPFLEPIKTSKILSGKPM